MSELNILWLLLLTIEKSEYVVYAVNLMFVFLLVAQFL